jgi:FtsP/CotA-like multicopper oxidase with cupredoxin domain
MRGFGRRRFLGQGSGALVHLLAARAIGHAEPARVVPEFRVPLPIPPVLSPVRADATTDYYELAHREAWVEILPGVRTRIRGYNGIFPGPTIRARRGRATVVTHTNHLDVPTVAHLHGGITRPEHDGFPTDAVEPGGTRRYEYANEGRAATLWYHDHSHRHAGRNLYMGLAGFYLLEEGDELEGQLPEGAHDVPLMLQDRSFRPDGELVYEHERHHGATGSVMLVNGAPWPVLDVAARKYRLRILNASNATAYRLALSTGRPLVQIATDGGWLPAPLPHATIDLAPAERVEVVVDFSSDPIGSRVILENLAANGPLGRVMCFDVVRRERDDSALTSALAEVEPLRRSQAVRTRTFVFGGKPTLGLPPGVRWVINGKPFDPERVDADPALGEIEVWRFVSRGFVGFNMLHPVHTHLVPFQVLSRNGDAPHSFEAGWKDTVAVDEGEEVEVIMRWTGHRGRYLLHCHNLEHEDHEMMARIDVT